VCHSTGWLLTTHRTVDKKRGGVQDRALCWEVVQKFGQCQHRQRPDLLYCWGQQQQAVCRGDHTYHTIKDVQHADQALAHVHAAHFAFLTPALPDNADCVQALPAEANVHLLY
jgi:hypothetical protein